MEWRARGSGKRRQWERRDRRRRTSSGGNPLRFEERWDFLARDARASWISLGGAFREDELRWRGRSCYGRIAGTKMGSRRSRGLATCEAPWMPRRLGLAGVREPLLSTKDAAAPLQYEGCAMRCSWRSRTPCHPIGLLPTWLPARRVHRQEEDERMEQFLRGAHDHPRGTWFRSSREGGRGTRGATSRASRFGPRSGHRPEKAVVRGPAPSCQHLSRQCSARGWRIWPGARALVKRQRSARTRTSSCQETGASSSGYQDGEAVASDLLRGREAEGEGREEASCRDSEEYRFAEEQEEREGSTEARGEEEQTKEGFEEEEEKEEEELQQQQPGRELLKFDGYATPSSEEEQEAPGISPGDATSPCAGGARREVDHRGHREDKSGGTIRQDDELLSDFSETSTTWKAARSARARDDSSSNRPAACRIGGRHVRRPGRTVCGVGDSRHHGVLELSTVSGSRPIPESRDCSTATPSQCSTASQDGGKGSRTELMGRKRKLEMVVRWQRRRRSEQCRRPRKRKRRESKRKEQKRKEGSVARQAKRRRRGSDSRCLKKFRAAPYLKAAAERSGAGQSFRKTARREEEEKRVSYEEEETGFFEKAVSSDPYYRELGCMIEEEAPEDTLPSAGANQRCSGRKAVSSELARFSHLRILGEDLVAGFALGSSEGAFSAFAKLLTPLGVSPSCASKQKRWGLFPLPVDFEGDFLRYTQATEADGAKTWLHLAALALNSLNGEKGPVPRERRSLQVARVLNNLHERIGRFLKCCGNETVDPESLWEELKNKKLSYDGEEVARPCPLTCQQIQSSLPPLGHGGSVALLPLLQGHARFLMEHPERSVLEMGERGEGPTTARVHILAGDELKVWKLLEERGVIEWLDEDSTYRDAGGVYRAGMFGVPKSGRYDEFGNQILRVIMNLKPINRVLQIIRGDIGELPSPVAWTQLVVTEDELIEISQADMSSAFYLFRLPPQWKPFLTFNCSFAKAEVGLVGEGRVVPSCVVLPMGWNSSVGLMQMASRQLLLMSSGNWDGELRRNALPPPWFVQSALRTGGEKWWQVYLDNFMAAEVRRKGSEPQRLSEELHFRTVEAWKQSGVLCAEDKHVRGSVDGTELGVNIQGEEGWLGGSPSRLQKVIAVTLMLLGQKLPKPRWVQVVLGRWIFILQFRRPAMAILSNCWNYLRSGHDRRRWWPVVKHELATLICLAPLLQSDLRTTFSSLVTCSDASEKGGAVACATEVLSAGISLTKRLQTSSADACRAEVLVISVFNGIGGAFRCYDLAGIKPAALIAIEIDPSANRVTRKAWPHVIEIGNVEQVTRATVQKWYNLFPRVTHVHTIGGFPCVHLSSARAGRLNLEGEGSRLFWNLKELIDNVEIVFGETAEVEFVVENVFSMDVSAREEISSILKVEPLVVCPSDLLPYSRPRLAWVSFEVSAGPGVSLERCQGYTRVWMNGQTVEDHQWLSPGWERCSAEVPFSCFMKSIPRARPPVAPAGLKRCDESTVARWQSDAYRFPPYQYRRENLVKDKSGSLRYLSSQEREVLLGFGSSHVLFAWSAGKVKEDKQGWEDKKLSLCGDSFSMLSFGWIISQGCKQWITPLSPSAIVKRMGLAPGASLAAHLEAPMSLDLNYGVLPGETVAPEALVAQIARHVNITGSDVSLAMGTPFNLKSANHSSLRAGWWAWKIVFKSRWVHESHINALEMRMIAQTIKWRSRFSSSIGCRWLHLADSMVCNYILSKGRTSSRLLQPLTREIAAQLLALNSTQLQAHVDSLENPTDEASREAYDQ